MDIVAALEQELAQHPYPIISEYELGRLVYRLYKLKAYRGSALHLSKTFADRAAYTRVLDRLTRMGVVGRSRRLPNHLLNLIDRESPEETVIACIADPFCYLSHHSALAAHDLAMRKPVAVYVTSLSSKMWRARARHSMMADLGEDYALYHESKLPRLTLGKLERIGTRRVRYHTSQELGERLSVPDSALRVATVGQTVLDSLRHPQWSGGMIHVLKVFDRVARDYQDAIIHAVDTRGTAIDKVRVGYLFEERLEVAHPTVDRWVQYVQRGGSRKLDPLSAYAPVWSDRWCLSLNA